MTRPTRRRLDAELVQRKLATSRSHAVELIEEGKVFVAGAPALNPARQVSSAEPMKVKGPKPKYVGRGGFKLEAALENFGIDPTGLRTIDVGASTGGFTDCLLQRGALTVTSLDVGHGQLHERLRADERVTVLERTNIRHVTLETLGAGSALEPFAIAVVDVSFISLRTIAEALLGLCAPGADLVLLIKPQFEAGKKEVSKGKGVIKDREIWNDVLLEVLAALNALGAATMGVMVSPVLGAEGNVEFLGWFRAGARPVGESTYMPDLTALLDQAEAQSGVEA